MMQNCSKQYYYMRSLVILLYRCKNSVVDPFCSTEGQKRLFNEDLTLLVHEMNCTVILGMKVQVSNREGKIFEGQKKGIGKFLNVK
jgi:hypothetical protein